MSGNGISIEDRDEAFRKLNRLLEAFDELPSTESIATRGGPSAHESSRFVGPYERRAKERAVALALMVERLRGSAEAFVENARNAIEDIIEQEEQAAAEFTKLASTVDGAGAPGVPPLLQSRPNIDEGFIRRLTSQ